MSGLVEILRRDLNRMDTYIIAVMLIVCACALMVSEDEKHKLKNSIKKTKLVKVSSDQLLPRSIELPVGCCVEYDGVPIEAVECHDNDCSPCYFGPNKHNVSCMCDLSCCFDQRSDYKRVIFKEVK